jgi:type IV pilus assembly protein PilN
MKLSINLASRSYVNRRLVGLGILLLSIFFAAVLLFQGNAYLSDRRLLMVCQERISELQSELNAKQSAQIDPQDVAAKQSALEEAQRLLKRDAFRWTTLFDRMEAVLPDGVSLLSFNPDYEKQSLNINGVALDLKSLQRFLDNLEEDDFDPVYLTSQGKREVDDGSGGKKSALTFSLNLGRLLL